MRRKYLMADNIKVMFTKTHKDAIVPEYQHHGDAGCDLFALEDVELYPQDIALIRTGISIQLPNESMEAQIRSRGGFAYSQGVIVLNSPGTVDYGYRGEIKIILMNVGKDAFSIKSGDRIAQMVFAHVYRGYFLEMTELDESVRGDGGFGSTGTN